MFASFRSLLRLLISAFRTSISCLSFWFSWMASCACLSSSSIFLRRSSRERLAAMLFFFLLSQYRSSFFSLGTGARFFLGGISWSESECVTEVWLLRSLPAAGRPGPESEMGGVRGSITASSRQVAAEYGCCLRCSVTNKHTHTHREIG